jgi:hypothetical protein
MPRRHKDEHSLRQTAKLHDISPGYLSKRVREGKSAKGYDLTGHARFDEDGGIECFVFPPGYEFPVPEEAEDAARENPLLSGDGAAASWPKDDDLPDVCAPPRAEPSDAQAEASSASARTGRAWEDAAANTLAGVVREDPEQSIHAAVEATKLFGGVVLAVSTGKYIYDGTREARPVARSNPASGDGEANGSPPASLGTALGVSAVVFLGTDYTVRGDESLLMRAAQCLGQTLNRLFESSTGDADAHLDTDREHTRRGHTSRAQHQLGEDRQRRARDGFSSFNGWHPHSGDGAASLQGRPPTAPRPSDSESLDGPL